MALPAPPVVRAWPGTPRRCARRRWRRTPRPAGTAAESGCRGTTPCGVTKLPEDGPGARVSGQAAPPARPAWASSRRPHRTPCAVAAGSAAATSAAATERRRQQCSVFHASAPSERVMVDMPNEMDGRVDRGCRCVQRCCQRSRRAGSESAARRGSGSMCCSFVTVQVISDQRSSAPWVAVLGQDRQVGRATSQQVVRGLATRLTGSCGVHQRPQCDRTKRKCDGGRYVSVLTTGSKDATDRRQARSGAASSDNGFAGVRSAVHRAERGPVTLCDMLGSLHRFPLRPFRKQWLSENRSTPAQVSRQGDALFRCRRAPTDAAPTIARTMAGKWGTRRWAPVTRLCVLARVHRLAVSRRRSLPLQEGLIGPPVTFQCVIPGLQAHVEAA